MASGSKTVAITGASGFVGSQLAERFENGGWSVTRLTRTGRDGSRDAVSFRLGDEVDPDEFRSRGVTALVHCAYDFKPTTWSAIHGINVEGSRKLFAGAKAGGVERIVAISTISAFPGCRSLYGRAKLEIEADAAKLGAVVVRPGLVYGPDLSHPGGMFGALSASARKRVVPLIDGGIHCQYLIHIDDLFELIRRMCAGDTAPPGRPVVAASPRCWPMRELVMQMARGQGTSPRFLSVPARAVWLGLKAAELVGLHLGYRSDSVVSLVFQDPHPDFSSIGVLGVTPRDFSPA